MCGGGGGIPVTEDDAGTLHGVDAVVDLNLTASLIARELGADLFVVLTDVPRLHSDREEIAAGAQFTAATGRPARIGPLDDATEIIAGRAGTLVTTEPATASAAPEPFGATP